jgi:hypothetical protein
VPQSRRNNIPGLAEKEAILHRPPHLNLHGTCTAFKIWESPSGCLLLKARSPRWEETVFSKRTQRDGDKDADGDEDADGNGNGNGDGDEDVDGDGDGEEDADEDWRWRLAMAMEE